MAADGSAAVGRQRGRRGERSRQAEHRRREGGGQEARFGGGRGAGFVRRKRGGLVEHILAFGPGDWQPQVALMAAVKVGLLEELLRRPATAAAAAQALGLHEEAVARVVRLLVDAGVLERDGDDAVVAVAPAARPYLDPVSPLYVGSRLLHSHNLLRRWLQLPEVLQRGGPAPFDYGDDTLRAFIGAMHDGARERAPRLASLLGRLFPETRVVLDVGGGPATQAVAFRRLGWEVTVLDFPEVVDLMIGELVGEGIHAVKGDAVAAFPPGRFDLVFMGNLCHSLSRAENETVVQRAAGALSPGGALAIYDLVRGTGLAASAFAVNMLVATSLGDVWSEDDYRAWCARAGLSGFAVHVVSQQAHRLLTAVAPRS